MLLRLLNSYHIHALHGFLGLASDWSSSKLMESHHFHAYQLPNDFPIMPLEAWAERFNHTINSNYASSKNIFLGYSLGGRLGLHAVLNNPQNWKAAIFISTHSGLKTVEERKNRLATDHRWAERFQNEPWDILMNHWNSQDVFMQNSSAVSMHRKESDYDRRFLSNVLTTWSLGVQKNLFARIASLEMPILWLVGERDLKFLSLGQELKFKHPQSKLCIVSEAGHRLHFEQSEKFNLNVTTFIQNLE